LELFIKYGDRYSQARTYFCLGSLAEAEGNLSEAKVNFEQALERYPEFSDEYCTNETRERIQNLGQ
jgi:tetratricopeptide (TPR) repeat protein